MGEPLRRWLNHTPPNWVNGSIYFVTLCCHTRGNNQLCQPKIADLLFSSAEQYHHSARWHMYLFLLMPDPLHALISLPSQNNFSQTIGSWKRYTARNDSIRWQKGFFDHRLRNDESFDEKRRTYA